jgi:DNA-binding GntR family transcriptional regulator
MKPEKRANIVGHLAEITRELERLTMSRAIEPNPAGIAALRAEQEELECSLCEIDAPSYRPASD